MNKELKKFSEDVVLEMEEMKKIGMKVPQKALDNAKDLNYMEDYYQTMGVSECADLVISLSQIH